MELLGAMQGNPTLVSQVRALLPRKRPVEEVIEMDMDDDEFDFDS